MLSFDDSFIKIPEYPYWINQETSSIKCQTTIAEMQVESSDSKRELPYLWGIDIV